VESVTALQ